MSGEQREVVVCATRGGEGSRAVQHTAVQYASEHDARLIFVFVVDARLFSDIPDLLKPALLHELQWVGHALLELAQRRARRNQVVAEFAILEGEVREQISGYLQELSAQRLFVGAPRGTTASVFGDDEIEQFAASVRAASGVEVVIVRPEDVELASAPSLPG